MTFIALVINPATGENTDFQRWDYKRPQTVALKMSELAKSPIMKYKGMICKIFETPNGYNYDKEKPVLTFKFK